MKVALPELQALLLDLLSERNTPDATLLAQLRQQEWKIVMGMVHQHRLAPLLHWQLSKSYRAGAIPDQVATELAEGFRNSAVRSLVLQRELLQLDAILNKANITYAALKGAYLAFHAYPHPACRPMRDLDILVPEKMALSAHKTLIDAGYQRPRQYRGNIHACLEVNKHFPPLRSPSGQINIEMHFRLSGPSSGEQEKPDLANDPGLWHRLIHRPITNRPLSYLSPTDHLLHLMIHAAYEHRFNNGPQMMRDLAYLIGSHAIDWPLLQQLAQRGGWSRGCLLSLAMTERYYKLPRIEFTDSDSTAKIPPDFTAAASLLSLRNITSRSDADALLMSELKGTVGIGDKISLYLKRAFPPKKVIAARYPVAEKSLRICLWYPVLWWRLLSQRVPEHLFRRLNKHVNREARMISQIDNWFQDEGQPNT